jgi:hypothetical protein
MEDMGMNMEGMDGGMKNPHAGVTMPGGVLQRAFQR